MVDLILDAIAANALPVPGDNTCFFLFLPYATFSEYDGTTYGGGSGNPAAFHNTAAYAGKRFEYVVLTYLHDGNDPDTFADWTTVISHELVEAVTDPDVGTGWIDVSKQPFQEVSDVCTTASNQLTGQFPRLDPCSILEPRAGEMRCARG